MSAARAERVGRVGYLVLDRPAALNALERDTIERLAAGLAAHAADPAVELVVIRSDDARAFCAGGDMKRARELVLADRHAELEDFFAAEYALNLAIARLEKPYVALLDGVAMGGGLGLSVHGSHRVTTERARLAMPETRIGFFPDVGATHFLTRLPRGVGRWLGTSGASVDGAEAVSVGLATHHVRAEALPALRARLEREGTAALGAALEAAAAGAATPEPALPARFARRAEWFSGTTREAIDATLARAAAAGSDDAEAQRRALDALSPHAVDLTLSLLDGDASRPLEAALAREREAGREAIRHPDFVEGIRAVLVDRDPPRWAPRG